jgi:hypothetical protein
VSVVFQAGFDDLAATLVTADGWSANPTSIQAGSPDGNCFRWSNFGAGTVSSHALPSSYATVIVGFAIRVTVNAFPTTNTILRLLNGTTRVADLQFSSNKLRVLNAAGTAVATGTTSLVLQRWFYVELKITVAGVSGACELRINGNTEIASTTGNFGSANVDHVQLMNSNSNGASLVATDFDDLYVIDTGTSPNTDYLCDSQHIPHIQTIYPTADGAHTDWTPNSGTAHFSRVNETSPDGDTSYVSTATAGNRDSYACGDLATSMTSVVCVSGRCYSREDDTARQIAVVARPTSTDHDGATQNLTSSYAIFRERWENDPDTSSPWLVSDVNGSEFGIKLVA